MLAVVDTGALYASLDLDDDHEASVKALSRPACACDALQLLP
jgi:hypothetical protein